MQRILFLCSRNRRRSPTAERIYGSEAGLEVASAGLAPDAEEPLTPEHLEGVDIVFVMEKAHRARLMTGFTRQLKNARVVCLDIADKYEFMDSDLVALLRARIEPHLRRGLARTERSST